MFLRLVKPQDILLSTFLILLYCGGKINVKVKVKLKIKVKVKVNVKVKIN